MLVAAHSVGVGLVLLVAGDWGTALGGWGTVTPAFFVRQFGVFLAVGAVVLYEVGQTAQFFSQQAGGGQLQREEEEQRESEH